MSGRTKKTLMAVLASVVIIGGGVWGYYKVTTIPPPDLTVAKSEDVAAYLGNSRGFARLPVDNRQEFLFRACQRFGEGEARVEFSRSLHRMPRRAREVFLDAVYDLTRVRIVEHARAFNKTSSRRERVRFVDRAIRNFEGMRRPLSGATVRGMGGPGAPAVNLGEPFKNDLPRGSDEFMKVAVAQTTARERAEIKPFVDAVAARYRELRDSGQLEQLYAQLGG